MNIKKEYRIEDYLFPALDFPFYFKTLYKDRGPKAFYQFYNRAHRRSYSRSLIKRFAPTGIGLEVGVGARTIAPVKRTILSDAFSTHGVHNSIAKVFFPADHIPYPDKSFSFLLSEHVLEHIPNPIKTLKEWMRVLQSQGVMILILPHKERNNDLHRPRTTLAHLLEDAEKNVCHPDYTHFEEWFELVVQKGLMPTHYSHQSREELVKNGSIHHHVWHPTDICELLIFLGNEIVFVDHKLSDRRDSFVVICKTKSIA